LEIVIIIEHWILNRKREVNQKKSDRRRRVKQRVSGNWNRFLHETTSAIDSLHCSGERKGQKRAEIEGDRVMRRCVRETLPHAKDRLSVVLVLGDAVFKQISFKWTIDHVSNRARGKERFERP